MRPKYDGNGQGPLETLEEPLHVNSSLGIRARIGMIGRACELEISETLLTRDMRIMDGTRVVFQGDKHDIFPQIVYEYKT